MTEQAIFLPIVRKYFEKDPLEAAHVLETMQDDDAIRLLKAIPASLAAETMIHLSDVSVASLIQKLPPYLFREIVEKVDAQKAASVFLLLPEETRHVFLGYLSEKKKKQIQELLTFPEDSAGRIMSTNFLAFYQDFKVKEAIQKIRQLAQKGSAASYAYVIDRDHKLAGVMNMRDMLLAPETSTLESVMKKDVFTINGFMDREKVANEISERKYFAVPVVDNENRLLGIVRAEQLIGNVQEEATEDLQKMFGAGGDERAFSPISFSLKQRLPWLYVNLATAFLAGSVVALFQNLIAKIAVLAVYLPIVAGQGGNSGTQALAVVMRGLAMREIPPEKAKQLIRKETTIGIVNGILIGSVTALVAWLWHGNPILGLVVGLAMLVNLTLAGLSGAVIPLAMKAIGLDPAQCSSIILTTITDVMGFFSFLGFAVLFQRFLI